MKQNNNKYYLKYWIVFISMLLISPVWADSLEENNQILKQADAIRSSDPQKFRDLLNGLSLRTETLSQEQKNYLNYLRGYERAFAGDMDTALILFKKVLEESASSLLRFRAGASIANTAAVTRHFTEGLTHLEQTLDLLPEIQNSEARQQGLQVASILYNQMGQYELGLQYANRLLSEAPEGRNLCIAKMLKLEAQFQLKTLEQNNKDIQSGLDTCKTHRETVGTNLIRTYRASLFMDKGQHQAALELLNQHITEVTAAKYPRLTSEFFYLLAKAHWTDDRFELADRYAARAVKESESLGHTLPIVKSYELLYQIAMKQNDLVSALDYHKKHAVADKAYINDITAKQLAYQLVSHQSIEMKRRVELLDKQNEVLKLEKKLSNKAAENNRLLIILLVAIIGFIALWAYKTKLTQVRLRRLAEYDSLTGICSRHHFTQRSQSTIEYCYSTEQEMAFILFDLDKFKVINDSFGHPTGDWALKNAVKACQTHTRKNDILGRLGGEEFAILLPGCDVETAEKLAEEHRRTIEVIDTTDSGHNFTITASFGITTASRSGYELKDLIADADEAMYKSKRDGRNRVTVFS
ncbi:GGDEF domain-containing protein [Pleionea sp. CnH1-48]|uniref:tetratricopeptide repeat-containing diguanylate cyclase n=1 Tax=Pleionea sp. CnH1-48 TaxID=2954494 RepID=UPI002097779C|nr:GGDEF domain-containing protein [Pleionea sp. CnH1-48]MCO7226884.1 GGDEF domain-containing protein [Pleionea sp. CnH1-48]